MKILITSDWHKPAINGVVTSIVNLYDQLIKDGHDVRILTLSRNLHSYKDGHIYYIKSIPFNVYPDVRASVLLFDELIDELVEWKPDVVHTQCEFFTYTYGKIVAKRANCPIVHTYHTMYEDYSSYLKIKKELGKHIIAFMSKKRLKDVTVVIAPTNKVKRTLKSYDITKDIKVIPSGLNMMSFKFKFNDEDRYKLRAKYNIPKNANLLLYLGRIGKEKNISEVLEYFKELISKREDTYLLIVGGGPYEKNIAKEIDQLNIGNRAIMAGMVNPIEVPLFYKSADIFVSASQSETQGLTYIEAMSNGLPQVCKYDECLDDVLLEGYNGYYFNNEKEFIEKISNILDNQSLKSEMKKNALEKSQRFSKEYFASSVINVYNLAVTLHQNKPRRIDFKLEELGGIFNFKNYWKRAKVYNLFKRIYGGKERWKISKKN